MKSLQVIDFILLAKQTLYH